jgi:23S rRNA pseudouridine1911/1915/1917 synthase
VTPRPLPAPDAGGPLLPWLLATLRPMSRTRVKELLRAGRVAVNGTPVTQFNHPLQPGDRVTLGPATVGRAAGPPGVPVVYEDDALLVIDKPAGLLSVATDGEREQTAFARLHAQLAARRAGRPFVVHRLDRDTSGLLMFARDPRTQDALRAAWPGVSKTYLALTEGEPRPAEGVVENFLVEGRDLRVRTCGPEDPGAKRAATRYRVVSAHGRYALVEVDLLTGRKHQIRAHLAGLGCPVAGDAAYGAATDPAGRLGLHAWRLAFDHPVTGRRVEVESPLPERLRRVIGERGA